MVAKIENPVTPAPDAVPVEITLGAAATIGASAPAVLRQAIREALTLPNPLYRDAEANGRSTRDIEPYLAYYRPMADRTISVPRGAARLMRDLCRTHDIPYRLVDATHAAASVAFAGRITLSAAQERAVGDVLARRMGVLEAPAGSGKTIMGLALIARRQQPALWIVHTKELAHQAVARAVVVLGLDEQEIGFVGDGQCTVGSGLTVALVQSLARYIPPALIEVGHVILDEAHHAPAEQVAAVLGQFRARYLLGLSATPYRRDGLGAVINFYLGDTTARIDKADLQDRLITPRVIKRDTGLRLFGDTFTGLVSDIVAAQDRNRLIVADVAAAVAAGRRCLILSDRVGHVEHLAAMLTVAGVAAAALHGQLGKRKRGEVVEGLATGTL